MKRIVILVIGLLLNVTALVQAQSRNLKKVMELNMPKTKEDENCGTRGAAVCWNPVLKKYYAAFAGNNDYPLAVFNAAGKLLSDTALTTMQDVRGLWFNTVTKKISGNTYNEDGWFSYTPDNKGIPTDFVTDFKGMNQPDEQSVGAYNALLKAVFFLDKSKIIYYDIKTAAPGKSLPLHWGRKKMQGPDESENEDYTHPDYNGTAAVYTGIRNAEYGVLNTKLKWIELYDQRLGFMQQSLVLPIDAPVNKMFNFAFANGIYWLFDIDNRKWIGYK